MSVPARSPVASCEFGRVETGVGILRCRLPPSVAAGNAVTLAIRPEDVALDDVSNPSADNAAAGEAVFSVYLGNLQDCTIRIGEQLIQIQVHPAATPVVGGRVVIRLPVERLSAMA